MNYQDKVISWNTFIKEKGVHRGYGQFPTLVYVKFGHEPAPLMFWKKWQISLILGINYGVMWGLMMHFFTWRQAKVPVNIQFVGAVFAGLAFGFCMSLVMKYQLKRLGLESWEKFLIDHAAKSKSA